MRSFRAKPRKSARVASGRIGSVTPAGSRINVDAPSGTNPDDQYGDGKGDTDRATNRQGERRQQVCLGLLLIPRHAVAPCGLIYPRKTFRIRIGKRAKHRLALVGFFARSALSGRCDHSVAPSATHAPRPPKVGWFMTHQVIRSVIMSYWNRCWNLGNSCGTTPLAPIDADLLEWGLLQPAQSSHLSLQCYCLPQAEKERSACAWITPPPRHALLRGRHAGKGRWRRHRPG